jgi:hypothetical protein
LLYSNIFVTEASVHSPIRPCIHCHINYYIVNVVKYILICLNQLSKVLHINAPYKVLFLYTLHIQATIPIISSCFTQTMQAMISPKIVFRDCLMSIALVLFVLHVHGVVEKYINGRTNFSTKETRPVAFKFPTFSFCPSQGFQKDKIKRYNISSKFLYMSTTNQQLYNKSVWDMY